MTSITTSTDIANEVRVTLAELAKTTEPLMLTGGPLFTGPDEWTRSVASLGGTPAERFRAAIDGPEYFWFASWYDVDGNVIPRSDRGPEWEEAELEGAPAGRLRTTKNAIWTTKSGHLFVSQGLWTPREETNLDGKPAFRFVSADFMAGLPTTVPCTIYGWCDGHDSLSPEDDGCHMTTLEYGKYEDGQSKYVHVLLSLPQDEGDGPAEWSFSMPEGADWSIDPGNIDAEIDEGIADLQRARAVMKAFLAEHGAAAVPA